jgi:hypothetical protein
MNTNNLFEKTTIIMIIDWCYFNTFFIYYINIVLYFKINKRGWNESVFIINIYKRGNFEMWQTH